MQTEPKSNFFRDFLIIIAILSLFVILIIGCSILIYNKFTKQAPKVEKTLLEPTKPDPAKADSVISKPAVRLPIPEPDTSHAASHDIGKEEPKDPEIVKAPEKEEEKIQLMPDKAEPGKIEPEVSQHPTQEEPETEEDPEEEPKDPEIVKAPEKPVSAANKQKNEPMTKDEFIEEVSNLSSVQKKNKPVVEENISQMNKDLITIVHFKNGRQLEGKVKEQNKQFLILENEGALLEIQKSEILRMEEIPLQEFQDKRKQKTTFKEPSFISGQEVIIMTYDDRVIQGSLIKMDSENITLLLDEGTFIIKRKNIRMIEKKQHEN